MAHTVPKGVLIGIALLCLASCCSAGRTALLNRNNHIPAKRFDSYSFDANSPIGSRVRPAPSFLLEYLRAIDKKDTYVSYEPTATEMTMVGDYLEKLPALHKSVLKERLLGIFFVEHFPGAGMADYVLDRNDKLYVFMVFNPEILKNTMSQWMTYRENSAFKKDSDTISLEVNCGALYSGFMYGLLHESSHALDYVLSYTPYTEYEINILKRGHVPKTTPFVKDVWIGHSKLAPGYNLPRGRVSLYGYLNGPHLSLQDAVPLYKNLAGTPFTSLCSLMSWSEDFAEYVTWYHFTARLGQPYTINVRESGLLTYSLSPMDSEIVKKREATLRSIYETSDQLH